MVCVAEEGFKSNLVCAEEEEDQESDDNSEDEFIIAKKPVVKKKAVQNKASADKPVQKKPASKPRVRLLIALISLATMDQCDDCRFRTNDRIGPRLVLIEQPPFWFVSSSPLSSTSVVLEPSLPYYIRETSGQSSHLRRSKLALLSFH